MIFFPPYLPICSPICYLDLYTPEDGSDLTTLRLSETLSSKLSGSGNKQSGDEITAALQTSLMGSRFDSVSGETKASIYSGMRLQSS